MRKGMSAPLPAIVAAAFLAACSSDNSSATEPAELAETQASSSSDESSSPADITSSDSSIPSTEPESSSSAKAQDKSEYSSAVSSSSATDISESSSSETESGFSNSSFVTSSSSSENDVESSSSPYLWNDEFDGSSLDASKWTFETGASGWGNNEWQFYTNRSENAFVQDGVLHIRANKENHEGAKYTSARMITKDKFSFTYGTVEARIALPVGKGIWPAFWMLGTNIDEISWPACGEIDIIEAVNDENIVYGTNHWAYEGSHAQYGNNTNDYYGTSLALDISQFHNYKMVWNENAITMYVDDFKYHEMSIEKDSDGKSAGGTDAFHKPFFFILNIAVAGDWPGFDVDDSQFPNEMLIDYIRVYK